MFRLMYCYFHRNNTIKKSNFDLCIKVTFSVTDKAISNVDDGEKYSMLVLLIEAHVLGKFTITTSEQSYIYCRYCFNFVGWSAGPP